MSMAVYDDADRIDDDAPVPAPTFAQILKRQLYLRARQLRRRVLVSIRNAFRIDEDFIRDQIVDGLRRDLEATTVALAQAVTGLNTLHERLEYHEYNIPRMRTLRTQFDQGKRAEKKAQSDQVEAAVKEESVLRERHGMGLLQ